MSYTAIVARAHTRPHPNADRLQLATVAGNQVVVGKDVQDGTLGVFFPTDGALSHEMIVFNNLYNKAACIKLGIGENDRYGFFDANRRVRAQSFRGEKSDGFWIELISLDWAGGDVASLREGDTFTELNGHVVCEKYVNPKTLRQMHFNLLKPRKQSRVFPEHDDTKQYRFLADVIPDDAIIYITEKLHGTSGRYGLVYDDIDLPWWKRQVNRVYPVFPTRAWRYLNGSRRVILEKRADVSTDFYGTQHFRYDVIDGVTLHKGEVLYFEIVGDVAPGMNPIMATQQVKGLKEDKLKEIQAQYGDVMRYTYGCPEGEHRMYVYKIALVNEDGISVEQPWSYVVRRCRELGLNTVPHVVTVPWIENESGNSSWRKVLQSYVDLLLEGPSLLDARHIREGVVLRIESPTQGISHLKAKSWTFGVLEGFWKEADTAVDTEEVS